MVGIRGLRALIAFGAFAAFATTASFAKPAWIGPADIGGVVTGPHGPEPGVWVIAETRQLGTPRYAKIVVTDSRGRFLVPDLPKAGYEVFARGYGIRDTLRIRAGGGSVVKLTATTATPAQAASIYPGGYWYSMLRIPTASAFAGAQRNRKIPAGATRDEWINVMKQGTCVGCHQLGDEATRAIPHAFAAAGSSQAQWVRRIESGQAGPDMIQRISTLGPLAFEYLADWTDRIAAGQVPEGRPERPAGIERNIVITTWDWLDDRSYVHDAISTDARNPTVNAYGLVYGGTELSTDHYPYLNPITNTVGVLTAPVRDGTPVAAGPVMAPSAYWGHERIWTSRADIHNQMFDEKGRLWMTASVRNPTDEPAFCKKGSSIPSARAFPLESSGRQLAMLDPKTGTYTFIDTCFTTHHLNFDANGVLWTSGDPRVVGWFDVRTWDRTHDVAKSQGWTPLIVDTDGNGKRGAYTEPGRRQELGRDARIVAPWYAVMTAPDGSVWGTDWANIQLPPIDLVRLVPGTDAPATALAEVFRIPAPAFGARGGGIDSHGVVWLGLASGQLASFDRRKCKRPLNGPGAAGGKLCPEGWSFHRLPGPSFESDPKIPVEASYYTWVDNFDTLGLGKDVPIVTGNEFDCLYAFVGGRFITIRVPYPLNFYAKGVDGRIDDANVGWKGRGVWTATGDRTPWHHEGGKGDRPMVLHIQVRPNPLAD